MQINKDRVRQDKLDIMVQNIIAAAVSKLIDEAYSAVFEGKMLKRTG